MRIIEEGIIVILKICIYHLLVPGELFAQADQEESPSNKKMKVNIFFGTTKALSVEELKTNALAVLKGKGFAVPTSAHCVINVQVEGKDSGCAVMFIDNDKQRHYLVHFNDRGQPSEIWGGAIRWGAATGPNDPKPEIPEGGIRTTNIFPLMRDPPQQQERHQP